MNDDGDDPQGVSQYELFCTPYETDANERGPESRKLGNLAVNAARLYFEKHGLIFQDVHLENDNGKDAFLGLAWSGPDAGLIVWLQIKGGRKYKRKVHIDKRYERRGEVSHRSADYSLRSAITPPRGSEGHHVIPITPRLRKIWSDSRPIFVIVQDPDDWQLYFGNLARMADLAMDDEKLVPLYPDLRLSPTKDDLDRFLRAASAEARNPNPPGRYMGGDVPDYVRYDDGTIGPSRFMLDATRRSEESP